MIPQSYDAWLNCITVDCKIEMTPQYVTERIRILSNTKDAETQNFKKLYGEAHLQNIVAWFHQAALKTV